MLPFWLFFITSISLIFIVGGIILYLGRFGKAPHVSYLITYLACGLVWVFTSVMEVVAQTESWLRFWGLIGTTFGIFTITWMLIFIFFYLDNHINPWNLVLFLGLAVVFGVTRWTNSTHSLFYTSLTVTKFGSSILLKREYGPLFALMICIDAIILLFVLFKIFQYRHMTHQVFRKQINIFAYFTILMITYNLFSALNFPISPLPIFSVFAILPGLGFTLTAFRANSINLVPLPRGDLLNIIQDAIIAISPDGIILDLNHEMSGILNKDWSRAVGNPLRGIFPDLALRIDDMIHVNEGLPESGSRPYKFRFLFRTLGKQYDTSIYDRHNNYLIILHDITPLIRSMSNTNQLARNDALTGIQNRRSVEAGIHQWLNQHQDSESSFCFALFDVDHFKQFNDTYGHQVGDEVLKQITTVFTQTIRTSDLFGRFGGDEFILFLSDVSEEQARKILERSIMMIAKEQLILESGTMLSPTISMGAVFFPKNGSMNYDELFSLTDEALYTAKENGRNQICFRKRSPFPFDDSLY